MTQQAHYIGTQRGILAMLRRKHVTTSPVNGFLQI
jgi:hypothetical protein